MQVLRLSRSWPMGFLNLPRAVALRFSLLVMGFTAVGSQILIIRELLVAFDGNEFFMGIIFGAWLISEAAGSFAARRSPAREDLQVRRFALLQTAIGISSVLGILIIRTFKYILDISTGEVLGPAHVAVVALLSIAPVAVADGALFPFGCRNASLVIRKEQASAWVYLIEAIGSFTAGMAFVFHLLYHLDPITLSVVILSINLLSVVLFLASFGKFRYLRNAASVLVIIAALLLVFSYPGRLHRKSSGIMWYEYPLIETRNSVYANIAVIRQEDQYTFFANGFPYAAVPGPGVSVEEAAHFPLLFHRQPEDILIIGGGAGGIIREVLKHQVKRIDYAEQDPLIIEMFGRFPTPVTEYELSHERVNIHTIEGRLFLKKTGPAYDAILLSLPIPVTLQLNRYYTVEFFSLAKSRLKAGGLLSISMPGSETFLAEEQRELNRMLYRTLKEVFPHVRVIIGEKNLFIASPDMGLKTIDGADLAARFKARNISASLMQEEYILYKTDVGRFGRFEQSISKTEGKRPNHDTNQRGTFEAMLFLHSVVSPGLVAFFRAADRIPLFLYLSAVAAVTLIAMVIQGRRKGLLFIHYAVATTGFMSMYMSIMLILSFQISYGNVYHYIGLLTSLFMIGTALGAFRAMKRKSTGLLYIESAVLMLIAVAYVFESAILRGGTTPMIIICLLMVLSGLLTGMEYPVAVSLSERRTGAAPGISGRLYALDLLGAFIGAVVTASVLIPTLGIRESLLVVTALKAGSAMLVYRGAKG